MIMSTVAESATTVQTDRLLWTDAVQRVSALAHAKLPEALHGRLERATSLVLSGAVWLEDDGHTCHVRASNGQGWYAVNGHCRCTDHTKAPNGLCKHRLAHGLYRRAGELVRDGLPTPPVALDAPSQPTAALAVPSTPLPEAPTSINVHLELAGRQVQLTLRDSDEGRLLARLEVVLQRFPLVVKPTDETPRCPKHGVVMRLNHGKDGSTWHSHKTGRRLVQGPLSCKVTRSSQNVELIILPHPMTISTFTVTQYIFSIHIEVRRRASFPPDFSSADVATWSTSAAGLVGEQKLQTIRDDVRDYVDRFINAYHSVNPRPAGSVAPPAASSPR
jgi:hypothetical protein